MSHFYLRCYLRSAGLVLAITGIAKICSGFGHALVLEELDPLFKISFGHLFVAVGFLELVIAGICFFYPRQTMPTVVVAWFATNLLAYRIGMVVMGWHHPCPCLGSFTGVIHLSATAADKLMKIVLAYLLIGSYVALGWNWCQHKKTKVQI